MSKGVACLVFVLVSIACTSVQAVSGSCATAATSEESNLSTTFLTEDNPYIEVTSFVLGVSPDERSPLPEKRDGTRIEKAPDATFNVSIPTATALLCLLGVINVSQHEDQSSSQQVPRHLPLLKILFRTVIASKAP